MLPARAPISVPICQKQPYEVATAFTRAAIFTGYMHEYWLRRHFVEAFSITLPVALPYAEPLVHFDKELVEAARDFLRNGGIVVDPEAKVASVSKILRWYSTDFGKNEMEMLKHDLEPAESEQLLELLANTQVKVLYQPYDWSLNI